MGQRFVFWAWKVWLRIFYAIQARWPLAAEIIGRIGIGLYIIFKLCRVCFR